MCLVAVVLGMVVTVLYILDEVLRRVRIDDDLVFLLFVGFFVLNLLAGFICLCGLIWRPRRFSLGGIGIGLVNFVWQFVLVVDSFGRMP